MTRLVLLHAGPTRWDDEDRLVGNHSLPLTHEAIESIRALVGALNFDVNRIYHPNGNDAVAQAAAIAAQRFELRPRRAADLHEVRLGLWEGAKRNEIRSRFRSAYERWMDDPLAVNPPDGEPLPHAVERLRGAVRKILRRSGGETVLLPLRPMAMQIVAGLLRLRTPQQIAADLHKRLPVETIDIGKEDLHRHLG